MSAYLLETPQPSSSSIPFSSTMIQSPNNQGQKSMDKYVVGPNPNFVHTNKSANKSRNDSSIFKIPFPFVEVTAYDSSLDKSATFLTTLRILRLSRAMEIEEQKLDQKVLPTTKGKKKDPNCPEPSSHNFPFTQDMFYSPNSEACLHVMYLLFDAYDTKETEIRFRDVWPTFDKKLEAVFRRISVNWLKELVKDYPDFFVGIKENTIPGLLVTPGGDRFLYFIECFSNFVAYQTAKRNLISEQPEDVVKTVFDKPILTSDTEITFRQMLVLMRETEIIANSTLQFRKQIVRNEIELQSRLKLLKSRKRLVLEEFSREEVAPAPAGNIITEEDLLPSLYEQLGNITGSLRFPRFIEMTFGPISELLEKASQAINLTNGLQASYDQFKRLWYILSMEPLTNRTLEGNTLFLDPNVCQSSSDSTEDKSFSDFINSVYNLTNGILIEENLNQLLPNTLLQEFKKAHMNFDYSNLILQDLLKRNDLLKSSATDIKVQLKLMQVRLHGINWSRVSKVQTPSLVRTFTSPSSSRRVELNAQTGLTPGLLNFMDENVHKKEVLKERQKDNPSAHTVMEESHSKSRLLPDNAESKQFASIERFVNKNKSAFANSPTSRYESNIATKPPLSKTRLSVPKSSRVEEEPKINQEEKENISLSLKFPHQRLILTPKKFTGDNSSLVINSPKLLKQNIPSPLSLNQSINNIKDSYNEGNDNEEINMHVDDDSDTSGSITPVGYDPDTQQRITRIMESLNDNDDPSPSPTPSPPPSVAEETSDNNKLTANSVKRKSVSRRQSLLNRLSNSSARTNCSDLSRSLLEEWKDDEKGIMDMSFNNSMCYDSQSE